MKKIALSMLCFCGFFSLFFAQVAHAQHRNHGNNNGQHIVVPPIITQYRVPPIVTYNGNYGHSEYRPRHRHFSPPPVVYYYQNQNYYQPQPMLQRVCNERFIQTEDGLVRELFNCRLVPVF